MLQRKITIAWAIAFAFTFGRTDARAQFYTEQRIPSAFAKSLSADILHGMNNTIHVIGLTEEVTFRLFDTYRGRSSVNYVKRDSLGLSSPLVVPDTGSFDFFGLGGTRHSYLYDAAIDQSDAPAVIFSKQFERLTDVVSQQFFEKPVVRCYMRVGNQWQKLLEEQGGKSPRIVIDRNGGMHFAYELQSPGRRDSNYYVARARVAYRYRTPSGTLTIPQIIDTGFVPQIHLDKLGNIHLLWLAADSSSSSSYQLRYSRQIAGGFTAPVVLFHSLRNRGLWGLAPQYFPNVSTFVDTNGGVHAGWGEARNYPNAKFFSLTYDGATIVVDSSSLFSSWDDGISFAYQQNGTVHATWRANEGSEDALYYSNTLSGRLFSTSRVFRSMVYVSSHRVFLNSRQTAHALLSDNVGLRLLRNLPVGADTLSPPIPNSVIPTGSRRTLLVDPLDRVWFIYSRTDITRDSVIMLARFQQPLAVQPPQAMPSEFSLYQNYPNPFNPSTTIGYQLPTMSRVTLKVFDVLGGEVATLVDEIQGSGFKNVDFDASQLASGVYYYRIQAETFSQTRKMVIIR